MYVRELDKKYKHYKDYPINELPDAIITPKSKGLEMFLDMGYLLVKTTKEYNYLSLLPRVKEHLRIAIDDEHGMYYRYVFNPTSKTPIELVARPRNGSIEFNPKTIEEVRHIISLPNPVICNISDSITDDELLDSFNITPHKSSRGRHILTFNVSGKESRQVTYNVSKISEYKYIINFSSGISTAVVRVGKYLSPLDSDRITIRHLCGIGMSLKTDSKTGSYFLEKLGFKESRDNVFVFNYARLNSRRFNKNVKSALMKENLNPDYNLDILIDKQPGSLTFNGLKLGLDKNYIRNNANVIVTSIGFNNLRPWSFIGKSENWVYRFEELTGKSVSDRLIVNLVKVNEKVLLHHVKLLGKIPLTIGYNDIPFGITHLDTIKELRGSNVVKTIKIEHGVLYFNTSLFYIA